MIWAKYRYGVVQHVADNYASTLCDSRDIPDARMKLWEFDNSRFDKRRLCIRCFGVLARDYDNEMVFRWVESTQLKQQRLRAV